jgi:hypothetical protein
MSQSVYYAECGYTEFRHEVILSVVVLNIVMQSVVTL